MWVLVLISIASATVGSRPSMHVHNLSYETVEFDSERGCNDGKTAINSISAKTDQRVAVCIPKEQCPAEICKKK